MYAGIRQRLRTRALVEAEGFYDWLKPFYTTLVLGSVFGFLAILYLGVTVNKLGHPGWCFFIALFVGIFGGLAAYSPPVLWGILGFATISRRYTVGSTLEAYTKKVAHAMLFLGTALVVIGITRIEHTDGVIAVLVILGLIAIISYLAKAPAKLYFKAIWLVLAVSGVGVTYYTWMYFHPQDLTTARIERALMVRADEVKNARAEELLARAEQGEKLSFAEYEELSALQKEREDHRVIGQAENVLYDTIGGRTTTKVVDVTSFDAQLVCGIRPGERDVTIPYQQIRLNEGDYTLSGVVVINGTPVETAKFKGPSEASVRVNDSGCVELSFNLTAAVRAMHIQPQRLNMTFE